jgi:hypothetical protein
MSPEYVAYIKSRKWKKIRAQRLELDGHCCQRCGSSDKLEVHHIHYNTLFNERMKDLRTLCYSCHHATHMVVRGGNMEPKKVKLEVKLEPQNPKGRPYKFRYQPIELADLLVPQIKGIADTQYGPSTDRWGGDAWWRFEGPEGVKEVIELLKSYFPQAEILGEELLTESKPPSEQHKEACRILNLSETSTLEEIRKARTKLRLDFEKVGTLLGWRKE